MQRLTFVQKKAPAWVIGSVPTLAGDVQQISTEWSRHDWAGMIRSRISGYRMHYAVPPGLYAAGSPTQDSDVFVTANYKLSFDMVRRSLRGMDAWVLVLDTASINVWCAAGKGTFGTDEVIKRITAACLSEVVSHRRIILPQLGAPGVNAAEIQKKTGFRVSFGPIEARDIPAYVQAGYKKSKEMSTITFSMIDRLILTPMEINPIMKRYPWFALGVLLIFGFEPSGILFKQAWFGGLLFLALGLAAVFAGAFVTPILLPFIPFRSFAIKGWIMGMLATTVVIRALPPAPEHQVFLTAAALLFFPALSSYIALQFTGATTYTGPSGVNKELKIGIPVYIIITGISFVLLILFKLREWEVL